MTDAIIQSYANFGLSGLVNIAFFVVITWCLKTSYAREKDAYSREKQAYAREKEYQDIIKQQNEIIIALSDQLPEIKSKLDMVLKEVEKDD